MNEGDQDEAAAVEAVASEETRREAMAEEGRERQFSNGVPGFPPGVLSAVDERGEWAARLRAKPVEGAGEAEEPDEAREDSGEFPEPSEQVREAASVLPDHWLELVDPMWDVKVDPPEWAVVGRWRSDSRGHIVEWRDNDEYSPSPVMRGWAEPADPIEAAIQLAVTGYGPAEDMDRALGTAELAYLVDADGAPVRTVTPDGTPIVPAFTSQAHLDMMGPMRHEVAAVGELASLLDDGYHLCINPAGAVTCVIDPRTIDTASAPPAADEQATS